LFFAACLPIYTDKKRTWVACLFLKNVNFDFMQANNACRILVYRGEKGLQRSLIMKGIHGEYEKPCLQNKQGFQVLF